MGNNLFPVETLHVRQGWQKLSFRKKFRDDLVQFNRPVFSLNLWLPSFYLEVSDLRQAACARWLYIHIHFEDTEITLTQPFGFCDLAGRHGDDFVEDAFSCCLQCFFSIHDSAHIHIHECPSG